MARYNREFLVPYLQNICALHLAKMKLEQRHAFLRAKASDHRAGKYNPKPDRAESFEPGCGTYFCSITGIGLWIFAIVMWVSPQKDTSTLVWPFFWAGLPFILIAIYCYYDLRKENASAVRRHNAAIAQYERVAEYNKQEQKKAIPYENEMKRCEQEMDRVEGMLQRVYGANIIPSKYRGLYPAVYLYDWFRTSQADDLDHALAMYVLEEIKSRLDQIIDNQSEMILNQRIMMANQQKSIQQQRNYENMMRAKLDQMHMTQEEQLRHTRLIESNTAATAYFAAADYIRNI